MRPLFPILLLLLSSSTTLVAMYPQKWLKSVNDSIKTLHDSSKVEGTLGVAVWSQKHQTWLHDFNKDKLFRPASTLKLVVTATAVNTLDPNWNPPTELKVYGLQKDSLLRGQMMWIGRGNPGASGRWFRDVRQTFLKLAQNLKDKGVNVFEGNIYQDSSRIEGPALPSSWEDRFYDRWYGAEVTAFSLNDNCFTARIHAAEEKDSLKTEIFPDIGEFDVNIDSLEIKKGRRSRVQYDHPRDSNSISLKGKIAEKSIYYQRTVPMRHTNRLFLAAWKWALDSLDIKFIPKEIQIPPPHFHTDTLAGVNMMSQITEINQRSQNLYAELLLRNLGYEVKGNGNLSNGVQVEMEFLHKIGIDTTSLKLLDGSGLSYGNRIRPATIAGLLAHMARHPKKQYFINSMAEPWMSAGGTRVRTLAYPQGSRYKTGYVNETQGLSGYIFTADGDTLTLALYLNGYKNSDKDAKSVLDSTWVLIANTYDKERSQKMRAKALWAQAQTDSIIKLDDRIKYFSENFKDLPYISGPTGEGLHDSLAAAPRINVEGFDCVTLLEHSFALASAKNPDEIFPKLQRIRYLNGKSDFNHRKHFFIEDWIRGDNLVKVHAEKGSIKEKRTMGRKKFYGFHKLPYSGKDQLSELEYLPKDIAIKRFPHKKWKGKNHIYGVALVDQLDWLWVTHAGFLILENGKRPIFRHAGSKAGRVLDQSFSRYMKTRKKIKGLVFFEFKDFDL